MNKLTTKNKLRFFIILAFVLLMTAYFILVVSVLSAGAQSPSECNVDPDWVQIYVEDSEVTPQIYGWVYFLNKCGEEFLIPIDPRAFVADLSQTRCLESSCNHDPIIEPDGEQP